MTLRNPIGQHLQRVKSVDDNWFVDQCQKAQYTTVTILDAAALSGRVQSEGGVPYTIFRDSKFEPAPPDLSVAQYARAVYDQIRQKVAQCGNPNVHIMVNCEQGASANRIRMYTELVRLSATDPHGPVGMVFLNASVGSIMTGFWGQVNEFLRPDMLEFLRTLDQYRHVRLASGAYAFVLGAHNYTSQYAWIAVNGGEHRVPTWEEANRIKIDWNKAQDHIGREYQGIRKALGYVWNSVSGKWGTTPTTERRADGTPVEPPWIILTEALIDDVGGVPIQATHFDGGNKPRGFNSLKTQWEQVWFKPDPHGLTLAKFSEWVWKIILQPEGYFIGLNNFCLGDTGGWDSFTTAPNGNPNMDYFNAVKGIRFDMPAHFFSSVGTPTPAPVPTPPVVVVPPTPAEPKPPPFVPSGLSEAEAARIAVLMRQMADIHNEIVVILDMANQRKIA